MQRLATVAEAIGGTTKKNEKIGILAGYFRSRSISEAAVSAVFLSGHAFPAWEETTLQVGGALIWQVLQDITQKSDAALTAAYRKHGDLGSAVYDLLISVAPPSSRPNLARQVGDFGGPTAGLNVLDVERCLRE